MRSKDIYKIIYGIAGMVPTGDPNEVFRDVMERGTSVSGRDRMQCEQIFMNIYMWDTPWWMWKGRVGRVGTYRETKIKLASN